MTERSLSRLFQRMGAEQASPALDLLDADTLVAASAGSLKGDRRNEVAARLSRSPVQTDLVRLLRELAPHAEVLAETANGRSSHVHVRHGRTQRHAAVARRHVRHARWLGLAACLTLVFGAVLWLPGMNRPDPAVNPAGLQASAKPDRIFTSKDRIFSMTDDSLAHAADDGLFHSSFNDG